MIVLAARIFSRPSFAYDAKLKFAPHIRSSSDDIRQWMAGRITIGSGARRHCEERSDENKKQEAERRKPLFRNLRARNPHPPPLAGED
jgi:hypothetical protein